MSDRALNEFPQPGRRRLLAAAVLLAALLLLACNDEGGGEMGQATGRPNDSDAEVRMTDAGLEFVRTPDQRFEGLSGYPFEPHYVEIDGLRMHYVDEGSRDGEVILLLHGEPSWSYLYRKMIPILADAGHRVIAADLIGMGRSDKPVELGVHTYDQQIRWVVQFIDRLGLDDITLFAQDWGSLIGLRIVGDDPDRFARVVMRTGSCP